MSEIGCNPIAPHGMCNTGVLFFDAVAFNIFKRAIISMLGSSVLKSGDRFMDSLLFVGAMNNAIPGQELFVEIWPHAMNYMAFFEIEMIDLTATNDIVFGHFLTDTYLHCFETTNDTTGETCGCMYFNSRLHGNQTRSLLSNMTRQLISPNCAIMAGLGEPMLPSHRASPVVDVNIDNGMGIVEPDPVPESSSISQNEESADGLSPGSGDHIQCSQLWPPVGSSFDLQQSFIDDMLTFDVHFVCKNAPSSVVVGSSAAGADETIAVSTATVDVNLYLSNNGTVMCTARGHNVLAIYDSHSNNHQEVMLSARFEGHLHCGEGVDWFFRATSFATRTEMAVVVTRTTGHTSDSVSADRVYRFGAVSIGTMSLTSVAPSGHYSYSVNQLLGQKPVALASQTQLVNALNDRALKGTGVMICCDTLKGLRTVRNVVTTYERGYVVIILASIPRELVPNEDNNAAALTAVMSEFRGFCKPRYMIFDTSMISNSDKLLPKVANAHCVIVHSAQLSNNRENRMKTSKYGHNRMYTDADITTYMSKSFAVKSIKFLYVDVYRSRMHYLSMLRMWLPAVSSPGIIMGSRYTNSVILPSIQTLNNNLFGEYRRDYEYLSIEGIMNNGTWGYAVLATFEEHMSDECRQLLRQYGSNLFDASLTHAPQSREEAAQGRGLLEVTTARVNRCSPGWYILKTL
jgi:hypothetical protein